MYLDHFKNNYSEVFEREVLTFHIDKYLDAFDKKHGIENLEYYKNLLNSEKVRILDDLEKEKEKGVFDLPTILKKKYIGGYVLMELEDLHQITAFLDGSFDEKSKKEFFGRIIKTLGSILNVQIIHQLMTDSESQTQNIEVPNVENQKRMKALFLERLGIDKILIEKGYTSNDSRAFAIRWLCGYDEVQNPTTWYDNYLYKHPISEKEKIELEKIENIILKYRKHHKEKLSLK